MNTKEVLELLSKSLCNLKFHPRCLNEIYTLLCNELNGKETKFFKTLQTQLVNINSFGPMVHTVDKNEILKGLGKKYYSIHLGHSSYNVRLILHFTAENTPLFLCAFYERAEKKKTNYTSFTSILDQRLSEMTGDDSNE